MKERVQITLQKSFVLHYRRYRETSLIVDIFSQDYGRLSVIAKGARRAKSKFAGILEPFRLLNLSWCGKSELVTLTHAEIILPTFELAGVSLYCGFYLNELLSRLLYRNDPHSALFSIYSETLALLQTEQTVERPLRFFELMLLKELGYGLQLQFEGQTGKAIEPEKLYDYQIEQGPVEAEIGNNIIHGSTLIGLRKHRLENAFELLEAKRLLRHAIDFHLEGKPLTSRSLFRVGKGRPCRAAAST